MLDEMEQIEAIWEAVKLAERKDETYHYNLYQIDAFYVEEKIHIAHNVRQSFKSFKATDMLRPYLGQIKLPKM